MHSWRDANLKKKRLSKNKVRQIVKQDCAIEGQLKLSNNKKKIEKTINILKTQRKVKEDKEESKKQRKGIQRKTKKRKDIHRKKNRGEDIESENSWKKNRKKRYREKSRKKRYTVNV